MSLPGLRKPGEDLAPVFKLLVNDTYLDVDVTSYIQEVSFESAIDMSDLMNITIQNPGFNFDGGPKFPPDFTQYKAFQPGNEVELWAGYGQPDQFVGRAIITRHLPNYPSEGIPTLTVKGYDKSYLMMNASGPLSLSQDRKVLLKNPRPAGVKDDQGKVFKDYTPASAVRAIASKYGFILDIDETDNDGVPLKTTSFLQKKGVSDFEIIKMLANLNRKELSVEYWKERDVLKYLQSHPNKTMPGRGWVLHWVKPTSTQDPELEFHYNNGDASSLLGFSAEYGLKDVITEVVMLAWDKAGQRWLSFNQVEDVEGESPTFKEGAGVQQRFKPVKGTVGEDGFTTKAAGIAKKNAKNKRRAVTHDPQMMQALHSATEFRMAAGGIAIDINTKIPFKTLEDAAAFAARWFKARKDNFIIATGHTIGVETMRAGQVHRLLGLGAMLSGDYYFISVKHKITPDTGYTCEFTARRILEDEK